MKTLLILLLLVPSLSWGNTVLRCDLIEEKPYHVSKYYKLDYPNNNIIYMAEGGDEIVYNYAERNAVFVHFDRYIENRKTSQIILNEYTLELAHFSWMSSGDSYVYDYQCEVVKKQL